MHAARIKLALIPRFALCVLALLSASFALAQIEIPRLTSPVIDDGEFFTRAEERHIEAHLRRLHAAGGPQMQIWTLPSLQGEPIESLSIRAAESWQLGKGNQDSVDTTGADNGLLLTIAKQERRYRLEVGQGLEGTITDLAAARLLRSTLQPALRSGKPAAGVQAIINQIAALTNVDAGATPSSRTSGPSPSHLIPYFIAALIMIGALLKLRGVGRGWQGSSRGHWGGGSGWGSGGGGGWSGGGGGFSGGGASGGW